MAKPISFGTAPCEDPPTSNLLIAARFRGVKLSVNVLTVRTTGVMLHSVLPCNGTGAALVRVVTFLMCMLS